MYMQGEMLTILKPFISACLNYTLHFLISIFTGGESRPQISWVPSGMGLPVEGSSDLSVTQVAGFHLLLLLLHLLLLFDSIARQVVFILRNLIV